MKVTIKGQVTIPVQVRGYLGITPHDDVNFCIADGRVLLVKTEPGKTEPTRGNRVPDAHLAALLRQNGVRTFYTHHRDFLSFRCLEVRDPFA